MRNLIVMIGANGAGKTSFLDVLSILAASASGNLQNLLQLKGGLNEILTIGKVQELEIKISMQVPEEQCLMYNLTLSPKGLSYEVRDEYLTQQRESPAKRNHSSILNHKVWILNIFKKKAEGL